MPDVSSLGRFIHAAIFPVPARSPRGVARLARPFSFREIEGLPKVVRRYFHAALVDEQPRIRIARVVQAGESASKGCQASESRRKRNTKGIDHVHAEARCDANAGRASMRATLFGLISLASAADSPELRAGALQRYLAEAALCPTALLPRHGVVWSARLDGANASLRLGSTTVSLDFTFGADGLIRSVYTPARAREMKGTFVKTPWRGHWFDYHEHEGMMIPRRGQVEWVLADGPEVYWRGRMLELSFLYF